MNVTDNAYSLIDEKLDEMEQCLNTGIFSGKTKNACLEIRSLLYDMRQIVATNFLVGGDDSLPPAA